MNPIHNIATDIPSDSTFLRNPPCARGSSGRAAILAIAVLVSCACGHAASPPFITTFADDTVGQLPAGWIGDASYPLVTAAAAAPGDSRSVLFSANNQGMRVGVGSVTNLQWDFWIRPAGTGRSLTIGTYDSMGRTGIWLSWGVTSGQVSYYANNVWTTVPGAGFVANQWYKVRLVARLTPAKTFDFYVGAAGSAALPASPQGRNLPLRGAATADFATAKALAYSLAASAYFDDSAIQIPPADGFEDGDLGGWTITGTAPQIAVGGADGSSNSLNFSASDNRIELPFELADDVTVDFKVYPTGSNRTLTFTLFDRDHHWGPYLALGVGSGQLNYYANEAWTAVPNVALTANAWHRIRLVARSIPAPTYDVYVSAANSDALPPAPQGVNLPARDATAVDFAAFELNGFGMTANCRVDNVEISQGLEPVAPIPSEPPADATTWLPTPSFRWMEAATADAYETELATDANFSSLIDADSIAINRYVHDRALPTGNVYWHVRARGTGGLASAYSAGRKLTIQTPPNAYTVPLGATASQIQSIVQSAVTPAVVNFTAGNYTNLNPTGTLMSITGKTNLIVNGNSANITFINPMAGFASLSKCKGVLLRNFNIDFNPVPFSVGTVVSRDTNQATFTMTLDSGMPPFNAPHMLSNWTYGVVLDSSIPGKIKGGTPLVLGTDKTYGVVVVNGNQYRLKLSVPSAISYFAVGDKYIQYARDTGGRTLITSSKSDDLTCLGITNFAISGMHYGLVDGGESRVLRCASLIKSGRWYGGNADGIHARYNTTGPWVEGCKFEGIGDDSVALYCKGVFIREKVSNTRLRLDSEFFNLATNATFTIFNPRDGVAIAQNLTVTGVTSIGGTNYFVDFTPAVTAAIQTTDPDPIKNDQVFNRTLLNQGFALRGNTFRNVRRYGSIIRASYGVIEGNTYEGTSDSAIICRNEPTYWRNGLQSTDIWIRDNVVTNCAYSTSAQSMGQIQLCLYKLGYVYGSWRAHQGIVIEGNEIWNWQDHGIVVRNAREIAVMDNLITAAPGVTFNNSRPHYAIYCDNAQDSLLATNGIADPRTLTAPVLVTNSQNITVEP